VIEKLETLLWFLQRPRLYRELGRRVVHWRVRTARSRAAEQEARRQGGAWASQRAVSRLEALRAIGVTTDGDASLAAAHPDLWSEAHRRAEATANSMGGPAEVDLLYTLVRAFRPALVVETGVAAGWSSLAILAALRDNGGGVLHSVDMPYPKRGNEHQVGAVVPEALRGSWTLHRLPDRDALPSILRTHPVIDLAHYDSDKSYEGRTFAYRLLWRHLRVGGLLVSDDIEDNLAFAEFCASVAPLAPLVVAKSKPGNYAGLLRKTRS
jgi:predicted O-methyltransferase YrrM